MSTITRSRPPRRGLDPAPRDRGGVGALLAVHRDADLRPEHRQLLGRGRPVHVAGHEHRGAALGVGGASLAAQVVLPDPGGPP